MSNLCPCHWSNCGCVPPVSTNTYTHRFIAACPNNGIPILYTLTIQTTGRVIQVEQITAATAALQGYHEEIAARLQELLGGHQTLVAHHHGVDIETRRC